MTAMFSEEACVTHAWHNNAHLPCVYLPRDACQWSNRPLLYRVPPATLPSTTQLPAFKCQPAAHASQNAYRKKSTCIRKRIQRMFLMHASENCLRLCNEGRYINKRNWSFVEWILLLEFNKLLYIRYDKWSNTLKLNDEIKVIAIIQVIIYLLNLRSSQWI